MSRTAPLERFVMLNPSQGNQGQDDRTLQRCISFAKTWGYDGIKVVNLFAFILTDPCKLKEQADISVTQFKALTALSSHGVRPFKPHLFH
ncbi:DUF1643 domain-containing protein [Exiguobacterium sp. SH0S7]|uniref:DUF1643 domain-containing protein n=1 Tax=Exiguobacterium sp. SH0S7 TaxID=2510951 RepID=UPI001040A0FE|nr:DUF1643 domain-containing protein [Exiguobacterium sp. SH0S7]